MRAKALAALAAFGIVLGHGALAQAPGVATGGSAGPTATLPGPAAQPGTGQTPAWLNLGQESPGATAGAGRPVSREQIQQSMEAAGYTGVSVAREGDEWVATGMLNGASKRLRIDPRTGQAR